MKSITSFFAYRQIDAKEKEKGIQNTIIFLLQFLFLYASFVKLTDYELFKAQIGKSSLITQYTNIIAWAVPFSEIAIAAILLSPKMRRIGLFASATMMFAFTLYIIIILIFSPTVPCSCGGILSSMGWTEHLLFNIAFTIIPLVGIYLSDKSTPIQYTD